MLSTGWGAPASFQNGFDPAEVGEGKYGSSVYVWDWSSRKLKQEIPLGSDGLVRIIGFWSVPVYQKFALQFNSPTFNCRFSLKAALKSILLSFPDPP